MQSAVQRFTINMTTRAPGPDRGKENKVIDSFIQRWLTELDSLSTVKERDLDIHQFRDNVDITD